MDMVVGNMVILHEQNETTRGYFVMDVSKCFLCKAVVAICTGIMMFKITKFGGMQCSNESMYHNPYYSGVLSI